MTRKEIARSIAKDIERFDNCPVLSEESLTTIEQALSLYAFDRLMLLRERITASTWAAREKALAFDLIDGLIHEDKSV